MDGSSSGAAEREWTTLQGLYERYEWGALAIKLGAVLLFFAGVVVELQAPWIVFLTLVLWLQEAIFKTFQARLGERLLQLERMLAAGRVSAAQVFQLHSNWLAERKGVTGLLAEYGRSALRPTVVFPYAVLLLALGWSALA